MTKILFPLSRPSISSLFHQSVWGPSIIPPFILITQREKPYLSKRTSQQKTSCTLLDSVMMKWKHSCWIIARGRQRWGWILRVGEFNLFPQRRGGGGGYHGAVIAKVIALEEKEEEPQAWPPSVKYHASWRRTRIVTAILEGLRANVLPMKSPLTRYSVASNHHLRRPFILSVCLHSDRRMG